MYTMGDLVAKTGSSPFDPGTGGSSERREKLARVLDRLKDDIEMSSSRELKESVKILGRVLGGKKKRRK